MADAVWRIARRPYALDRLGIGAQESGGRWNRPGTPVIYAGSTIAIAALEKFVHLAGIVPPDLVVARIELPDRYSSEVAVGLPKNWDALPPDSESMDFGSAWARENRSLVLYVPSVLVPEERNAVLNPNHREFGSATMTIQRSFRFDSRMFTGAVR